MKEFARLDILETRMMKLSAKHTTLEQEYKEIRSLNHKRIEIMENKIIHLNSLMNTKCIPRVNDADLNMKSLDNEITKQIVELQLNF